MPSGFDVNTHMVVGVHTAEVDTHEAGVQPRGEAVTDMAYTGLCLWWGEECVHNCVVLTEYVVVEIQETTYTGNRTKGQ